MNSMTETIPSAPATPGPGANIVTEAIEALAPFYPTSRDQVLSLVGAWSRRAALNVYNVEAVLNHFFPVELIDPPACPAWCDGIHLSEDTGDEFRDCTSEEVLLPARTNGGTQVTALQVNAVRTFDKTTGKLSRPMVQMEDFELTPREARALAAELARMADLADGTAK